MAIYPIGVRPRQYRGTDRNKLQKMVAVRHDAAQIQEYVNQRFKSSGKSSLVIHYDEISRDTGISESIIRDLLYPTYGGHNGITVYSG